MIEVVAICVLALTNLGMGYALIAQSRAQIAERTALLTSVGALRRQDNRAALSRTALEYERAEAVGAAIEETARRNHITEDDPPYEGFG